MFNLGVLDMKPEAPGAVDALLNEKVVEVSALVLHKDYGEGTIAKVTGEKVYVELGKKQRIFPYPDAFE